MSLTKKEQKRYTSIVASLCYLSRDGWRHASPDEYQPLERELAQLQEKRDCPAKKRERLPRAGDPGPELLARLFPFGGGRR